MTSLSQDEIIKELREIREAYGERFDFDTEAIYHDAKAREAESNREVVQLEPKRLSKETI